MATVSCSSDHKHENHDWASSAYVSKRAEQLSKAFAGFKAGTGDGHQMVNRTESNVKYLEIGDRSTGDDVNYPDDDMKFVVGADGKRQIVRKDGSAY